MGCSLRAKGNKASYPLPLPLGILPCVEERGPDRSRGWSEATTLGMGQASMVTPAFDGS